MKGRGSAFSFRSFGGPGGIRFKTRPRGKGSLDEIFGQAQRAQHQDVRYELTITETEASQGAKKLLTRKGKKLEVRVPRGVKTGSTVKLSNARQITDGQPGDILIRIKVKIEE